MQHFVVRFIQVMLCHTPATITQCTHFHHDICTNLNDLGDLDAGEIGSNPDNCRPVNTVRTATDQWQLTGDNAEFNSATLEITIAVHKSGTDRHIYNKACALISDFSGYGTAMWPAVCTVSINLLSRLMQNMLLRLHTAFPHKHQAEAVMVPNKERQHTNPGACRQSHQTPQHFCLAGPCGLRAIHVSNLVEAP